MTRLLPLLAVAALAGCAGGADDPVGVWMIQIGYFEPEDATVTITHDYLNAVPEPEIPDTSGWTSESAYEISDMLGFAEIFAVEGEEYDYALATQGFALPGVEQDDGSLLFSWTTFEHETSSVTHWSGYSFTEGRTGDYTLSIELAIEDGVGTGTLGIHVVEGHAWTESDLWNGPETGFDSGQTPAESYLDATTPGNLVENLHDRTDCSASPCTLERTFEAAASQGFAAIRTGVEPGGFESVEYSGIPFGGEDFFLFGP